MAGPMGYRANNERVSTERYSNLILHYNTFSDVLSNNPPTCVVVYLGGLRQDASRLMRDWTLYVDHHDTDHYNNYLH